MCVCVWLCHVIQSSVLISLFANLQGMNVFVYTLVNIFAWFYWHADLI